MAGAPGKKPVRGVDIDEDGNETELIFTPRAKSNNHTLDAWLTIASPAKPPVTQPNPNSQAITTSPGRPIPLENTAKATATNGKKRVYDDDDEAEIASVAKKAKLTHLDTVGTNRTREGSARDGGEINRVVHAPNAGRTIAPARRHNAAATSTMSIPQTVSAAGNQGVRPQAVSTAGNQEARPQPSPIVRPPAQVEGWSPVQEVEGYLKSIAVTVKVLCTNHVRLCTGFVIRKYPPGCYVLTCAHILRRSIFMEAAVFRNDPARLRPLAATVVRSSHYIGGDGMDGFADLSLLWVSDPQGVFADVVPPALAPPELPLPKHLCFSLASAPDNSLRNFRGLYEKRTTYNMKWPGAGTCLDEVRVLNMGNQPIGGSAGAPVVNASSMLVGLSMGILAQERCIMVPVTVIRDFIGPHVGSTLGEYRERLGIAGALNRDA